jgi:superfamily II DNA/RNA helicase
MIENNCICQVDSEVILSYGQIYECNKCQKYIWCNDHKERKLSWLPEINYENGELYRSETGESDFFRDIRKKPKIVRLEDLSVFLKDQPRLLVKRLEEIQNFVSKFGLELNRLYSKDDVEKDESLIFSLQSNGITKKLMINENNEKTPISNSESTDVYTDQERLDTNTLAGVLLGNLKSKQSFAITKIMEEPGSLTIIALPTGYGKTRIGQFLTWLNRKEKKRGPTLLISPLIALMDDQRDQFDKFNTQLKKHGLQILNNKFLTSVEKATFRSIKDDLLKDNIDVICCSPDTLLSPVSGNHWVEIFLQMKNPFSTIIVDEAHTIGDWGSSIRPEFQLLGWVKDRLLQKNPDLRVILQSATITENEEEELLRLFKRGLKINQTIREPKLRRDISFNVVKEQKGIDERIFSRNWLNFLYSERSKIPARWSSEQSQRVSNAGKSPLLVYTPTRDFAEKQLSKECLEIFCNNNSKLLGKYTGETSPDQRDRIRCKFLNDEVKVLVATSAFGMGIDKEDVWTIAYLGMPFTLKGLYQGFGRAARNSRFGDSKNEWRSGNCLAIIPDRNARNYKAELGIKKTLERIWMMFYLSEETIFTKNGYMILPAIPSLNQKATWNPIKSSKYKSTEFDSFHEEDQMDEVWNLEQELAVFTAEQKNERNKKLGLLKRKSALFGYNMWTITCLQRTRRVEFLGLHHPIIKRNRKDNSEIKLVEILENEGYIGLINSINKKGDWQTPANQNRMAVLRFKTNIVGRSDIIDLVEEGHRELIKRYDRGKDEMNLFLKNITRPGPEDNPNSCIRKELAPAIGKKRTESRTCFQLSREEGILVMPCNNCRELFGFQSLTNSGFIWSTSKNLAIIKGEIFHNNSKDLNEMSIVDIKKIIKDKEYEAIVRRNFEDFYSDDIVEELTIEKNLSEQEFILFSWNGRKQYDAKISISDDKIVCPPKITWEDDAGAIIFKSSQARFVNVTGLEEEE